MPDDRDNEPRFPSPEARRELDQWVLDNARQLRRRMANDTRARIDSGKAHADESQDLLLQALKTAEASAKANSDLANTVNNLVGALRQLGLPLPDTPLKAVRDGEAKLYTPSIPEWRTYPGFRTYMVGIERSIRKGLPRDKADFSGRRHGDSVRSITRTMRHYGLRDDQWPPSTWPEEQTNLLEVSHIKPYVHAAVVFGATTILDLLYDNRIDGVVRAFKLIGCQLFGFT